MRTLFLALCLLFTLLTRAQELNVKVAVNHTKVNSTEQNVFDELQNKIQALLNERTWTQYKYKEQERIQCSFSITVNEYKQETNAFKCALLMTCNRPVYNSMYTTTLYSVKDADFNFEFQTTDQFEYSGPNNLQSNLVAMLAYYAHVIIGYDLDSFAPLGGTAVLQAAEDIVTQAQDLGYTGWKAFDDTKNRFALLNDYLDGSMEPYRQLIYKYHREGLDHMADQPDEARKAITEALDLLDQSRQAKNMSQLPQLFTEYKRDELVNIYAGKGTSSEKQPIVDILKRVDMSQSATWEKILK